MRLAAHRRAGIRVARSDLLINLVRATSHGDWDKTRSTIEALAAEEKAKNHHILAERLIDALNSAPNNGTKIRGKLRGSGQTPEAVYERQPRRRLEDLFLPEATRDAAYQVIEEQTRAGLLRSHGLDPRHRLLLTGPPGNGKTSLAEAIAESLALPFLVVRYELLIGSYLGETASRLKAIFDYARTMPCVLFFDEFDTIGKERGDIHETGEIKRVVSSLLLQMDELPSYTVLVTASNHAELLDRATWRRFQMQLELPPPSRRQLGHYIAAMMQNIPEYSGRAPESIARTLYPLSYSEAEEFCQDIHRRMVLGLGLGGTRDLVSSELKLWRNRRKPKNSTEGQSDGREADFTSSDTHARHSDKS